MFLVRSSLVLISLSLLTSPLLVAPSVREWREDDSSSLYKKAKGFKTASDNRPRHVVVLLKDESVSEVRESLNRKTDRDETKAIVRNLKGKQQALHAEVEMCGGKVIQQYQHALNGVRIEITPEDEEQLRNHPDVVDILPVGTYQRLNVESVPFIGAPKIWNQIPRGLGLHGEGIKVGIIDSGIDYTHANFGGPGTVDAYNAANSASTLPADPLLFGPGAPKIKGGYDFTGDSYDGTNIPNPDTNPLDCASGLLTGAGGYGSYTAGIVGGFGVKSDGTTYTGLYDDSINATEAFLIDPGVAPKVDLYAYRIFGCFGGSTNVVIDAIDRAIADDMDVINLGFHTDFGLYSADSVAVSNAVRSGVVVIAGAGYGYETPYISASPAIFDAVISVAAIDSRQTNPGVSITTSDGVVITVQNSNDSSFVDGTEITIIMLEDDPNTPNPSDDESLGCKLGDFPSPMPSDTLIVLRRGICARVDKALNGQLAGAAAVLMINNGDGYPVLEGVVPGLTIPFFGALESDTATFQQYNSSPITITKTVIINPDFRKKTSSSSSGPRVGDSFLKPEISAPGALITSAAAGTGYQGIGFSGTSSACPHVAGVAALVRQAHPTWSVVEIKAAIMSTANSSALVDFNPRYEGAGLVNPFTATQTSVWVASEDILKKNTYGSVAVNFGYVEISSKIYTSAKESVIISNRGTKDVTFLVSVTNKAGVPHSITLSKTKVKVKPKKTVTLDLTLQAPAATAGDSSGFTDASGTIVFTPVGSGNNGISLRLPYYIVPRAVSFITASIKSVSGSSSMYNVLLTNTNGPIAGFQPVDLFVWGIQVNETKNSTFSAVHAVGVRSDFNSPIGGDETDPLITFAINTYKRWSSPSYVRFKINIDVDPQNGNGYDYFILVADFSWYFNYIATGSIQSYIFSTRSMDYFNGFYYYDPTFATTDSSVVVLHILSSFLCAPGEPCLDVTNNPRFTYSIESGVYVDPFGDSSKLFDLFVPFPGLGSFNPFMPAMTFTSSQVDPIGVGKSNSTVVMVNETEFANTQALGVLVIAPDNKAGTGQALELSLPKAMSTVTKKPTKKPKGKKK